MNGYTLWTAASSGDGVQRCSRDRWVYNVIDCLDSQNEYITPTLKDQGLVISMDYDTCIPLHTSIVDGTPQWTESDIAERYKQIKNSCNLTY